MSFHTSRFTRFAAIYVKGERKVKTQFLKSRSYKSTWYIVSNLYVLGCELTIQLIVTAKSSVPEQISRMTAILEAMLRA